MLIAIDIGLNNTGYALFEEEKYLLSNTITLLTSSSLFSSLYYSLTDIIKSNQVKKIIYEEPQIFINRKRGKELLKVAGMIEAISIENKAECYCYNPMTIKKIITNSGKASKKEIKLSIIDILERKGYKLIGKQTEHSIDAIAIGYTHFLLQTKENNQDQ